MCRGKTLVLSDNSFNICMNSLNCINEMSYRGKYLTINCTLAVNWLHLGRRIMRVEF